MDGGDNFRGQLGLGDFMHRNAPQEIAHVSDATAVAAGDIHTLILHADGSVSATIRMANSVRATQTSIFRHSHV